MFYDNCISLSSELNWSVMYSKQTETILLIDDNPVNNQLVATFLLPCGYTIQIAENGKDGLRLAKENLPDLILLDVMMPDMDGYEVCRQLRADDLTAEIPVLFITAGASPENHKRAFNVGGNDFITKPIYEMVLRVRVQNLITMTNSMRKLEELNKQHALSQKISCTGHWACKQDLGHRPVCGCSSQLVDILAIDPAIVDDLAIGEFLAVLTENANDRERIVKQWIEAQGSGGDFKELITCRINGQKKNLRVWVNFSSTASSLKAFGSVQDVTGLMEMIYEETRLENRVADSDRYNAMVESGTQLAHELNQPLASITLNVNATKMYLQGADFDRDEICEIIKDVESEVMRAKEVVERMRNVANRKPLQLESFDLHELIRKTSRIFERDFSEANITMLQSGIDLPCPVTVDKAGVQQVLVNVIKNAYESLRENPVDDPRVVLSTSETEDTIRIFISNNGADVDEAITSSMFSPFVTTKSDNLGLGLAICKSIVTRLGGEIKHLPVDAGSGAAFCITIPKEFSTV